MRCVIVCQSVALWPNFFFLFIVFIQCIELNKMEDWNGDMDYDVRFCLNWCIFISFSNSLILRAGDLEGRREDGILVSLTLKIIYSVLYIEINTPLPFLYFSPSPLFFVLL